MHQLLKKIGSALAAVLIGATFTFAQQGAPPAGSQSTPTQTRPQAVSPLLGNSGAAKPNSSSAPGLAQPAYLTPISGLQGVLAETLEGTTLAAQSVDERFNPASSVKLATALVALQTFGPDHRFVTSVWAAGKIDRSTGILTGDLIVTGRDPSFHYEHVVMLARELNHLGVRNVTGNLIVAPGFTMNFDWSAKHSGEEFLETVDAARRSAAATRAWLDERTLVGDSESLRSVPSLVISGQVIVGPAPTGSVPLLTHKSSKLVDVLKVLLCYSNNFMAERIGETLGGPQTIRARLEDKLKISPDEVRWSVK